MNTFDIKNIDELVKIVSSQGLWFFALYIVYHYIGQLFSAFIILRVISKIIDIVNNWILSWFELKREVLGLKKK